MKKEEFIEGQWYTGGTWLSKFCNHEGNEVWGTIWQGIDLNEPKEKRNKYIQRLHINYSPNMKPASSELVHEYFPDEIMIENTYEIF